MSLPAFALRIVAWQREHGRNHLPWIGQDAYSVWLSEVMLQQTQVVTVLPYYAKFKAHFPDLFALANAPLDQVLALWAGLGYYSRARHLHRCAQLLCQQYGGVFPSDMAALQALPGIGPSTAGAIVSLAHQQRAAILDGNVKRVLARHAGVRGWAGESNVLKQLWALAQHRLIDADSRVEPEHHRRYTQGLMDLGAAVCTAKSPLCAACPIAQDCVANLQQLQAQLPQARPKTHKPTQSRCALVVHTQNGVWLERRPNQGLWGGLLSLPEAGDEAACKQLAAKLGALPTGDGSPQASPWSAWHIHRLKHTFTHYHLDWQLWACSAPDTFALPAPWQFCAWDQLRSVGVPKAVLKVLLAD